MKKLLLAMVAVIAIGLVGAHFVIARQVDGQLERMAARAAPQGRLTWEGVLVDPRGSIHVRDLQFMPHDSRDRLKIDRLSIHGGSPQALWALIQSLDSNQLPDQMGLAARGLNLPVNRELDQWLAPLQPALPFAAAGCPAIEPLSYYDLGQLGFWDLTLDLKLEYQLVNQRENLEINGELRFRQLAEARLRLRLELADAADNARPGSVLQEQMRLVMAVFDYTNLGVYQRLQEICAESWEGLGQDKDELASHVAAWEARWLEAGLQPGPLVLAGYRHFLSQPESIKVDLRPDRPVSLLLEPRSSLVEQLARQNAYFSINDGTPIRLVLSTTRARPAPEPAPEPEPRQTPDVRDEASDEARIITGPGRGWQQISLAQAELHIGARIRIEKLDGSSFSGRLVEVDDEEFHIVIQSRQGQFVRPIRRAQIMRIEVRP